MPTDKPGKVVRKTKGDKPKLTSVGKLNNKHNSSLLLRLHLLADQLEQTVDEILKK